jgi:hypothetical protein
MVHADYVESSSRNVHHGREPTSRPFLSGISTSAVHTASTSENTMRTPKKKDEAQLTEFGRKVCDGIEEAGALGGGATASEIGKAINEPVRVVEAMLNDLLERGFVADFCGVGVWDPGPVYVTVKSPKNRRSASSQ